MPTFYHSKNARVYMRGYDLTRYLNSIDSPATVDTAEVTTFSTEAAPYKNYVAGNADATLSAEGFFDGSSNAVDEVLSEALGDTGGLWTWYPGNDTLGRVGYGFSALSNAYNVRGTIDDACRITAGAQSKTARERLVSLHALQERTSSGEGTAIDQEAATTGGAVGYLQVTEVSSGLSAYVQHSTSGSTWDDLITFTATTERTSERITATGDVKQYVRAAWETTGATFHIGFGRK